MYLILSYIQASHLSDLVVGLQEPCFWLDWIFDLLEVLSEIRFKLSRDVEGEALFSCLALVWKFYLPIILVLRTK